LANIAAKQRLQFIHEGSRVERFHTRPGHTPDTDGRHSHGVAMLVYLLSPVMPSAELLMEALSHDLAEQFTGDTPAPAKWRMEDNGRALDAMEKQMRQKFGLLFPITEEEQRLLKLADSLDGLLWCAHEAALGNRYVRLIYDRWEAYMQTLLSTCSQRELEIVVAVHNIWEESCGGPYYAGPRFDVFKFGE